MMEIITKQLRALSNGVGAPIEDSSSAPSCLQQHHSTVQHSKLCWCPALLPALALSVSLSTRSIWSGLVIEIVEKFYLVSITLQIYKILHADKENNNRADIVKERERARVRETGN